MYGIAKTMRIAEKLREERTYKVFFCNKMGTLKRAGFWMEATLRLNQQRAAPMPVSSKWPGSKMLCSLSSHQKGKISSADCVKYSCVTSVQCYRIYGNLLQINSVKYYELIMGLYVILRNTVKYKILYYGILNYIHCLPAKSNLKLL